MAENPSLVHEEYEEMESRWHRARTVLAGEDAVKACGEQYLPMLPTQDTTEYNSYRRRAQFVEATGRTASGLHGLLFLKEPDTTLPDKGEFEPLESDVDMRGSSIPDYASTVAEEVIAVGRAGTLVDWSDDEKRPAFRMYKAEEILNWRMTRFAGRMVLSELALKERADEDAKIEQIRVYELTAGAVVCEIWQLLPKKGTSKSAGETEKEWRLVETRLPSRRSEFLNFIPFVFHSPTQRKDYCCAKPPLEAVITVNLHHYLVSADYNHALHYVACPTAWVAGFPEKSKLSIGSSVAWVSTNVNAKAGMLQVSGDLTAHVTALEKDERYMAVLGARLLENQKKEAETAEALRLRQSGESSVLASIALSLTSSLSQALQIAVWWFGSEVKPSDVEDTKIEINMDFSVERMAPDELVALIGAWQKLAISRDTLLYNLKKGEILPPKRTAEDEIELIESGTDDILKFSEESSRAAAAGKAPPAA